ncbi:19766_t:CDS:2, partial [Racocetra fulgida]
NINQPDNEYVNDNRDNINQLDNEYHAENIRETDESMSYQQSINVIFRILEQTTLVNNSTQADNIESIQDNDHEKGLDVSDYDSPGWSECEECYRNKEELCEYCGCSVCKWKGDRDHILLCDGPCGKNFHTDEISVQKDKRLKSKSVKKYKTPQDTLDSDDDDSKNIRKFSKTKTMG